MKIVESFKKLPAGWQIAIMLGGGAVLLTGGIALATGGSKAAAPRKGEEPLPGPGPTLPPIPLKRPYNVTHRGITATIGQDPDDDTKWIAVYRINGEDFGIGEVRTNESGIIKRFQDAVDAYYASVVWVPIKVASGFTLKAGSTYRLSLAADELIALPITSLRRESYTLDTLPADWPAEDRSDPTRQRYTLRPSTDFPIPPMTKAFAWMLGRARA